MSPTEGWASPGEDDPTWVSPAPDTLAVPRPMKVAPGCPLEETPGREHRGFDQQQMLVFTGFHAATRTRADHASGTAVLPPLPLSWLA